jgi:hypothetical protein
MWHVGAPLLPAGFLHPWVALQSTVTSRRVRLLDTAPGEEEDSWRALATSAQRWMATGSRGSKAAAEPRGVKRGARAALSFCFVLFAHIYIPERLPWFL